MREERAGWSSRKDTLTPETGDPFSTTRPLIPDSPGESVAEAVGMGVNVLVLVGWEVPGRKVGVMVGVAANVPLEVGPTVWLADGVVSVVGMLSELGDGVGASMVRRVAKGVYEVRGVIVGGNTSMLIGCKPVAETAGVNVAVFTQGRGG